MNETLTFLEPLEEEGFESILEKMIEGLPEDLDLSEGSHAYNLLAPVASQLNEFISHQLVETTKLIFPRYSVGNDEVADLHAAANGIKRKPALEATGQIKVIGEIGKKIPEGSYFYTESTDDAPSIQFHSTHDAEITSADEEVEQDGTIVDGVRAITIEIKADEAGRAGNVIAGSIKHYDGDVEGLLVSQTAPTINGVDEESTESLLGRVVEYEASQGVGFVGCLADYKRWAEEVPGVGVAFVEAVPTASTAENTETTPEDAGKVRIVIVPASKTEENQSLSRSGRGGTLIQAVEAHIMGSDAQSLQRLAPVNAGIIVREAAELEIYVTAKINAEIGADIEAIKAQFLNDAQDYVRQVTEDDRVLRYSKVAALLSNIKGVIDFTELKVDTVPEPSGTANIEIPVYNIPVIVLTEQSGTADQTAQ